MIAYVIAGVIFGFCAPDFIAMQSPRTVSVPVLVCPLFAYVGGTAAHAVWSLIM